MCRVTALQSDARLPPEQNGPAEKQAAPSPPLTFRRWRPKFQSYRFILFSSVLLSGTCCLEQQQVRKAPLPTIIIYTLTMLCMFQFSTQLTTAQTMTFHQHLEKRASFHYLGGRIWTMLPDTKLTRTERVCWQGGSDSPTSISVCLIYSSLVNQKLENWTTVSCF